MVVGKLVGRQAYFFRSTTIARLTICFFRIYIHIHVHVYIYIRFFTVAVVVVVVVEVVAVVVAGRRAELGVDTG